ncbi:MAG: MauE/DoxX family redox-associated membrane protein [Spirochaetia bacterium]
MPRESKAVTWLGFAVRLAAAAVWIASGSAKIPEMQAFQVLVQRYGILPDVLTGPFAYILPFFELAIGLYLAAGLFVRGTAFVGTLMFAVFLGAQASAWARGISLDCGCFGTTFMQTAVGPLTMLRDFLLAIPTIVMLVFPARTLSLDHRLFGARNMFGGARPRNSNT